MSQSSLFKTTPKAASSKTGTSDHVPLAARMRPRTLKEFIGQEKLVGKNGPIRKLIERDELVSMVFWGPPGCGKTTLAEIIANETESEFIHLSGVDAGVKDIREVVRKARDIQKAYDKKTILFLDEIHRLNKAQQDRLLPHVENGIITLIGATTENPSFEVISPLLSRCRVFVFEQHKVEDIKKIVRKALKDKERGLGKLDVTIRKDALEFLAQAANGDPRTALNGLELAVRLAKPA